MAQCPISVPVKLFLVFFFYVIAQQDLMYGTTSIWLKQRLVCGIAGFFDISNL